jgi:hypothetical protein
VSQVLIDDFWGEGDDELPDELPPMDDPGFIPGDVAPVVPALPGRVEEVLRPGDTWRPVDLRTVLAVGYEQPTPTVGVVLDCDFQLWYAGRINAVFGDSGGGKTWVAYKAVAEALLAGRDAVVIDYEDHPAACVARLIALGVPQDVVYDRLCYIQPQERWCLPAEAALVETLASRDVQVAVLDSTGEGMSLDSVNPNSDDEVARWFRGAARFLTRSGAAVILIDHTVKGQANGRNIDFASGSQRKRAAVNGAAYLLEVLQAPSRTNDGKLKLVVKKDRFGWRKHESVACYIEMLNQDDGSIDMTLTAPDPAKAEESRSARRTWYMEQVSRFIEKQEFPPSLRSVLAAPIGRAGGGTSKEYVKDAINTLRDEGYISSEKGKPFVMGRTYRESEDPVLYPDLLKPVEEF